MKILIGAGQTRLYFSKKFQTELEKNNIQCKLSLYSDIVRKVPNKSISDWFASKGISDLFTSIKEFKKLTADFKPDLVLVDLVNNFGLDAIKQKIPLFIHLRGDYWSEKEWARDTQYTSMIRRSVLNHRIKIGEKCYLGSSAILPICRYLDNIVNNKFPNHPTYVFRGGIDTAEWNRVETDQLKHPCVGLLQKASIWGKTKEMFILEQVIPKFPSVTFYWAGGGYYENKVLERLNKFKNFVWLGKLQYPDKVREFLSEIDLYALVTGIDMLPSTLLEAQLLEKPVIATDVGGVNETMVNLKSGYLVAQGNAEELCEKIDLLLNDSQLSTEMGKNGRSYVQETFSFDVLTKDFINNAMRLLDSL